MNVPLRFTVGRSRAALDDHVAVVVTT